MRVKDLDAASGFVHGFRCNIEALTLLVAEKYHKQPLPPTYQSVVNVTDSEALHTTLQKLSLYITEMVSESTSLFELFGYMSVMMTFQNSSDNNLEIKVWPPFPREYNAERWINHKGIKIEIVFEYGFHRYPGGENTPTSYFTLPADHFNPYMSAYIHPVLHVYIDEKEVGEHHMQESLISRWDIDDYEIDNATNQDQYRNVVFNACRQALSLEDKFPEKSILPVTEEYLDKCYSLLTPHQIEAALKQNPFLQYIC